MTRALRLAQAGLVALVLVACSSGSEQTDPVATDQSVATEAPVATEEPTVVSIELREIPSEQFCANGNAFVTYTPARLVATPDAATFVDIDDRLFDLLQVAPGNLTDTVATLRAGFSAIGEAYADIDFDPAGTLTLDPEVQDATAAAGTRLRSYLLTDCDLTATIDAQIAQIAEAFGIDDVATAECVHAQFGDVANIDSSSLTPELMTAPVCGTSILGLLSGESG